MGETMTVAVAALAAGGVCFAVGFGLGVILGAARAADVDRDVAALRAQSRQITLPSEWEEHPSNFRRFRVVKDDR